MSEFNNLFSDEFFYIDSENLNDVKKKLYGYAIINNEIVYENSLEDDSGLNGSGAYIYIKVDEEKINIFQDFNGCYGLYFYQDDDFFAISNSFMYLVECLKDKKHISLNKEFADAFLFADLCTYSYGGTLINEIKVLPRNIIVNIDITNKKINFDEIDYEEQSIDIDSEEGLANLDKWYFKWVELFRSIKSRTNNISVDLSGGFDSRLVSALWLSANIDLNEIRVKTHEDTKYVHKEDYRIASLIADDFQFKLNQSSFNGVVKRFEDIATPLNISFYTKLGFHKQMYFKVSRNSEPVYTVTGEGGESLRRYPNKTPIEYWNHVKHICNKYDPSMLDSTNYVVNESLENIKNKFNLENNSKEIAKKHYDEVRSRYHFGKASVESMFSNWITLTPLLDKDLRKLNLKNEKSKDNMLLFALIFSRYCPKLLEYEFEGNRKIDEETINYAKELNKKYPLKKVDYSFVSNKKDKTYKLTREGVTLKSIEGYVEKIFYSNEFQLKFKKLFSEKDYDIISELLKKQNYHPLRHVYSSLASIIVNEYVLFNNKFTNKTVFDLIDNFNVEKKIKDEESFDKKLLLKYATSRVDIKNIGENNSIELIDVSDKDITIDCPGWFNKNNEKGIIFSSYKGFLDIKLKCIGKGTLKIWLRTIDMKIKNGKRIPIYIDYERFMVNNQNNFLKPKLITHDTPFIFIKEVNDNEIIKIHLEWKPLNHNSEMISLK